MISADTFRIRVGNDEQGMRLDQYLAAHVPDLSRRKARVLLEIGGVFVDRARVKVASRKVRGGQRIEVFMGSVLARATKQTGATARAKDETLTAQHHLLFEDDDLLVVDKPAGLVTAPTPESDRGNLADRLSRERNSRVFVVHRIDRDTSGILAFAKTENANRILSDIFREHNVLRQYHAVVIGAWPSELTCIEQDIAGKSARSDFEVLERFGDRATMLAVRLTTGRTHQIRIHTSNAGYPVVGDKKYGRVSDLAPPRMALHAHLLAFPHPKTVASNEACAAHTERFEIDVAADLAEWLSTIR